MEGYCEILDSRTNEEAMVTSSDPHNAPLTSAHTKITLGAYV